MKTYFVKTTEVGALQSALSRMLEFAMFMAEEGGYKPRIDFINEILEDENIQIEIKDI